MNTFLQKLLFQLCLISAILGCAPTVMVYQPSEYSSPDRTFPYAVKLVQLKDASPYFEWEGDQMYGKGRRNLVKGGDGILFLSPLTPDLMSQYLVKEFGASGRFKSVTLAPVETKPAKHEIIMTGDIKQATWDCPDGDSGPFSDSCQYRIEIILRGAIGDGGTWKKHVQIVSPAQRTRYTGLNSKEKAIKHNENNLSKALQLAFGQLLTSLSGYLNDPIQRSLDSLPPAEIASAVNRAVDAKQWKVAYRLSAGSEDKALLSKVCTQMAKQGDRVTESARTLLIKGGTLAKAKRYAAAIDKYSSLIEKYPGVKKAHFNRAVVMAANKDYKNAVKAMYCYTQMPLNAKELRKAKDKIAAWEEL